MAPGETVLQNREEALHVLRAGEFKPESDEEEEEEEESSGGGSSGESLVDSDEEAGEEEDEDDDEEAGLSWEELEEEAMQCGPWTRMPQLDYQRPVTRRPAPLGGAGAGCRSYPVAPS